MQHNKFDEILKLVSHDISVLIHGPSGVGKTTVISQIAEELGFTFYALSMTRQTTLSHLLGFMNVNGIYVPSLLRKAVESGGVFLLDELDAADPNVVLALNTLENGFISFPDVVVKVHKDFRLVATANPFDEHSHYTGRAKLDAATLDRFDKIALNRDRKLEASLVSSETFDEIERLRQVIEKNNVDLQISMRDAIRWEKRKELGITANYIENVLLNKTDGLYAEYLTTKSKVSLKQQYAETAAELWSAMNGEN